MDIACKCKHCDILYEILCQKLSEVALILLEKCLRGITHFFKKYLIYFISGMSHSHKNKYEMPVINI